MGLTRKIIQFLENPDSFSFVYGLELYEKAGPGLEWPYLKKFKYSSPGKEAWQILISELNSLLEFIEPAGDPPAAPAGISHLNQVKPEIKDPLPIQNLKKEQKELLKRRDKVHSEMCYIALQEPESEDRRIKLHERAIELMSDIIPRLDHIVGLPKDSTKNKIENY